jgi:ribosome maturation factor RimP
MLLNDSLAITKEELLYYVQVGATHFFCTQMTLDTETVTLPSKLTAIIENALAPMGYALVRLRFIGGKQRSTLQIMAEPLDGSVMTLEGCEAISRRISPLLEVEDPIVGAYNLEVSSPGLDRPLVKAADFERYSGYEVKIELAVLQEGRRKFRGLLSGIDNNIVQLRDGEATFALPLDNIREAKLVITEQRIQEALKGTAA